MQRSRKKLIAVAGLSLSMTLLAACGSSGGASTGGSGGSAASGKSDSLTSVTIAYAAVGAGYSDLYVGKEDGIFKRYGLNVKLVQITPSDLIPGLVSGSVQIAGGVADGAASAILKGEKLKFVALTEGTYNLQLWVNKDIKTIHDLVGKTVAVTTHGSETDFGLTAMLKENGIDPSAVSRKYLVTTPQMLSAMASGAVAAGLFQPPNAQKLTQTGGRVLTSLSNLPYAVGAYSTTLSYAQKNPGVITKFVEAEAANLAFIRSHPAQTLAAIEKFNTQTNAHDAGIAYRFFLHVWKQNPAVTPSLIQAAFQRAAAKIGVAPPQNVAKYIYKS